MLTPTDQIKKLGYDTNLPDLINEVATFYRLGPVNSFKHLDEGYEDYNIKLVTASGTYVLKLFANNQLGDYSKTRKGQDVVERLVEIYEEVERIGINAPRIKKAPDGQTIFRKENDIVGIIYDWIEGETYYEIDSTPTEEELDSILEQCAKINSISLKPIYYHDIWAVNHIHELYKKVESYLDQDDKEMLTEIIRRFDALSFNSLPKCFVHGDFTKGNIIKTPSGEPYLIDFSVSNWTARIVELGLIVSNLMYDEKKNTSLNDRVDRAICIYKKYGTLTDREEKSLFDLALASTAMEFLGSRWRQEFLDDESEETKYWLKLGREGIRSALAE